MKSEIEKARLLHDVKQNFTLSDDVSEAMARQLAAPHQANIARFLRGYEIEDWFGFIFAGLPWVRLIHDLGQRQMPSESKSAYQVPDYLVLCETSRLTNRALLVEVKRVGGKKNSLKLSKAQVVLSREYARVVGLPLVFAIYWESLNAWTINTPDSFEKKTSTLKLSLPTALALDCALVFGDISFFVNSQLVRHQLYSRRKECATSVQHKDYGFMVSDSVTADRRSSKLEPVESAALDCMFDWAIGEVKRDGDGTTLCEATDALYLPKSSSWITRHLAMFHKRPDEAFAKMSFNVVAFLMEKLAFPRFHMFPWNSKIADIRQLADLFFGQKEVEF